MKKILSSLLFVVAFIFTPHTALACTQTIAANTTAQNSISFTGQLYGAESFTADCSGTVSSISVGMHARNLTLDPYTVSFYTNNAGQPGTLVATSNGTVLTGNACYAPSFTFASPPSLVLGTIYWIVVTNGTTNATNYSFYCGSATNPEWYSGNTVTALVSTGANSAGYASFVITEGGAVVSAATTFFRFFWWW
jgi:hypothetical protein